MMVARLGGDVWKRGAGKFLGGGVRLYLKKRGGRKREIRDGGEEVGVWVSTVDGGEGGRQYVSMACILRLKRKRFRVKSEIKKRERWARAEDWGRLIGSSGKRLGVNAARWVWILGRVASNREMLVNEKGGTDERMDQNGRGAGGFRLQAGHWRGG